MTSTEFTQILTFAERAYISFKEPNWLFAQKTYDRHIYKDLISELKNIVSVIDDTDLNNDVSYVYYLNSQIENWVLKLSFIGPYGYMEGLLIGDNLTIGTDLSGSILEEKILLLLKKHYIRILNSDELEHPIHIKLHLADNPTLYNLLFSDTY